MGLQLLGVVRLHLPATPVFRWAGRPDTQWRAFAVGLPFGLVVTPCTVPIFFAIVTFVAFRAEVAHGALLMAAYALGRGAVLVTVGLFAGGLKALGNRRLTRAIERGSGILLVTVSGGLLLFYDAFVGLTGQWMPPAH